METLKMSRKERDRLTILAGVKEQELTLVQASELMGGVLPPEQAHLATVSGRRGRGTPVGLRYAPASLRPATPTGERV
jgi:hypothetical protein